MEKKAFIFPGQGSQYVGMAKEFYDKYDVAREVVDKAARISGYDLAHIMFEENEEIHITKFTQIAMLAAEVAVLRVLEADGVRADVTAGLSLGEYAALVASGMMKEEDAFHLITVRGKLMQEAVPEGGAMSAVLGLDAGTIEDICAKTEGIVSVANYNCPGQTVITGESGAVEKASAALKEAGAKRCQPLKVSGPFHSVMLKEAGEQLLKEMQGIEIRKGQIPYVTNVTADYVTEPDEVKPFLQQQISSPVRWQQSVERMAADGTLCFIEIGPKKSLTGFMKRIAPQAAAYHIDTLADYEEVLKKL